MQFFDYLLEVRCDGLLKKGRIVAVIGILLFLCSSTVVYADVADPLPGSRYLDYIAQPESLENALLTVIIEVPLFYLLGYRRLYDCAYFAGVNIITNLLLNECLQFATDDTWYLCLLVVGESMVVALEFALCLYGLRTEGKNLFRTLLLTNMASFLVGVIYYIFF